MAWSHRASPLTALVWLNLAFAHRAAVRLLAVWARLCLALLALDMDIVAIKSGVK